MSTHRESNRVAWLVVILIAAVALVAVVFLFTRPEGFGGGEAESTLESAGRQVEEAGAEAGAAVSRAGERVEETRAKEQP